MDLSRFLPVATPPGPSRRTLLGAALASAGASTAVAGAAGKKKNKKRCKGKATRCGKKRCCRPGEACVNRRCVAPGTRTPKTTTTTTTTGTPTTTTTPAPFTAVSCGAPPVSNPVVAPPRFAQVFAATGTGSIATASFEVSDFAENTPLGVEIRTTQNGALTTIVLGTAFIFGIPPSAGEETLTATFAPKVAVEQGETYALVITNLIPNQATNEFKISTRSLTNCPLPFFADPQGDNNFVPQNASLVFTVSP